MGTHAATLLMTRPPAASARFAEAARARFGGGFSLVSAPLFDVVATAEPADPAEWDGVILTSEAALGVMPPPPPGLRAWCVGARTAEAAAAAGYDAVAAGGTLAELVALVGAAAPAGRLLHPRGVHTAGGAAAPLAARGIEVTERIVYDQAALPMSAAGRAALAAEGPVYLPVFSPRSAALLTPFLSGARAGLRVAAMSEAVRGALVLPQAARLAVAASPSAAAMLDALGTLGLGGNFLEKGNGGR